MKSLLTFFVLAFSLSAFAQFSQNIIIGKVAENPSLCAFKSTSGLEGAAYINVVGNCAWDPAMNGMLLTLTIVPEDVMDDSFEVDLGQMIRSVKKVSASKTEVRIEVIQDAFNVKEEIIQVKKIITVVPRKVDGKFTSAFKITVK